MLIYDLQIEADGRGDESLLQKSDRIKKLMEMCWDESEGFYFDNHIESKQRYDVKSLAGFIPLFTEMVEKPRAQLMMQQLKNYIAPGGLKSGNVENGSGLAANSVISNSTYLYLILKGMCDYEFMEDAADIGENWLNMTIENYESTGELWNWYNVNDKSNKSTSGGANMASIGLTGGVFIALVDLLGLA
jgi:alpha,alpha-trehalase